MPGTLSLCRLSLYDPSSETFDPFDAAQRSDALVAEADACAGTASCGLKRWLEEGRTYFVALWAAEPPPDDPEVEEPTEASFTYTARLRAPAAVSLSVAGHRIKEGCTSYHEVVRGRDFTLTAKVKASGTVRFDKQWWTGSEWDPRSPATKTLSSEVAVLRREAGSSGKYRWRATFLGNDTLLPAASAWRRVSYASPRWDRFADGGVRLKVPYHRQQYSLSCEAAALRMAHNYHHPGRIDSDRSVYRITGVEWRFPARTGGCNPDERFCRDDDGVMMKTGYGVHYRPIARAATELDECRPGVKLKDYSFTSLARHINNGYPVVVWGAHKGPAGIVKVRWRAHDGHLVTAYSVEHTLTVIGFHGKPSDPRSFIVHDPSRGSGGTKTLSWSQLYAFTKYFKTAVVVRG